MGCELEPEYREQLFRFADAISHDLGTATGCAVSVRSPQGDPWRVITATFG